MAQNNHHVMWERLYVAPPPTDPPCRDTDPAVFDLGYYSGVNVMARDASAPRAAYASQIAVALRYCAMCPLVTRAWCLNAVQPQPAGYSGIAGGAVWSNGRRVWDVDRQQRLDAAPRAGAA